MSSTQNVKGHELFNLIDADSVAEKAETKFHDDNIKRSRLSTKIVHHMPHAMIVVALAAVALSAPFTVLFFGEMFSDIMIGSKNFKILFINLAPITIEGVILLLSAVNEYGKGSKWQSFLLGLLLTFSTLVNVLGAISVLLSTRGFDTWLDKAYIGTAVLAGILVSFVGYIVGGLVIKLATGEITMEIDSSKAWHGTVKHNALKRAFENAASKLTTETRAQKYALIMARRYSEVIEVVEETVDAIGHASSGGQAVGVVASLDSISSQIRPNEMGFSPMARGHVGNLASNDYHTENSDMTVQTHDRIRRMSPAHIIEWMEKYPNTWQQWRIYKTQGDNCKYIAMQLSEDGSPTGAKSVERAFKQLGIEL